MLCKMYMTIRYHDLFGQEKETFLSKYTLIRNEMSHNKIWKAQKLQLPGLSPSGYVSKLPLLVVDDCNYLYSPFPGLDPIAAHLVLQHKIRL